MNPIVSICLTSPTMILFGGKQKWTPPSIHISDFVPACTTTWRLSLLGRGMSDCGRSMDLRRKLRLVFLLMKSHTYPQLMGVNGFASRPE